MELFELGIFRMNEPQRKFVIAAVAIVTTIITMAATLIAVSLA